MNSYRRWAYVYRAVEALRGREDVPYLEIARAYRRYLSKVDKEPKP
jgi:hypothetical protein